MSKYGAEVFAYADDITVWTIGDTINEIQVKLDAAMAAVLDWLIKNNLKPNPKKFQCLGLGVNGDQIRFKVGDILLTNQDCIVLLGMRIDRLFKFEKHIKHLTKTIAWKLSGIRRLKNFASRKVKWKLVNTYIPVSYTHLTLPTILLV